MRIATLCLTALLASSAWATQPLRDGITIDGHSGHLDRTQAGPSSLPDSMRLRDRRMAERCSAHGGPVGKFDYVDGKLWLVALTVCAGDVPLKDIYPELNSPVLATWLTGTFRVTIYPLCRTAAGDVHANKQRLLKVQDGIDVSPENERSFDLSGCLVVTPPP